MISRIKRKENGEVGLEVLKASYEFESLEGGGRVNMNQNKFSRYVRGIFPGVKVERKQIKHERKSFYKGIELSPLSMNSINLSHSNELCLYDMNIIKQCVPEKISINEFEENKLVCELVTPFTVNGSVIRKQITLQSCGKWKLFITGTDVDLRALSIDDAYANDEEGVSLVFEIAEKLNICKGIKVTKSVVCSRYHTLESLEINNVKTMNLRSISCAKVVCFSAWGGCCRVCQKMNSMKTAKENTIPEEVDENNNCSKPKKVTAEDFKHLIPCATSDMIKLLLSQAENAGRNPRGRRWTRDIISVCLQLYNRSPLGYASLRDSGLLLLPSPSLLVLYKSNVNQTPGFKFETFEWIMKQ